MDKKTNDLLNEVNQKVEKLNESADLFGDDYGSGAGASTKRFFRKIITFCTRPITGKQSNYNAYNVEALRTIADSLNNIEETRSESEELLAVEKVMQVFDAHEKQIEQLTTKIVALEMRIQELESKNGK